MSYLPLRRDLETRSEPQPLCCIAYDEGLNGLASGFDPDAVVEIELEAVRRRITGRFGVTSRDAQPIRSLSPLFVFATI